MSTILTAAFQTIQRDSAICFPMLGNLTINPPSYFTVFGFKIYFYGVIIALGFILGIVCCTRICARFGIKEDDMYDAILVIIPTANTKAEPMELFEWEIRVQAMQNQIFVAMCNRVGREDGMDFAGESLIVHPSGDVIVKADNAQQLVTCEIDLAESRLWRGKRPYISTRRPDMYL